MSIFENDRPFVEGEQVVYIAPNSRRSIMTLGRVTRTIAYSEKGSKFRQSDGRMMGGVFASDACSIKHGTSEEFARIRHRDEWEARLAEVQQLWRTTSPKDLADADLAALKAVLVEVQARKQETKGD